MSLPYWNTRTVSYHIRFAIIRILVFSFVPIPVSFTFHTYTFFENFSPQICSRFSFLSLSYTTRAILLTVYYVCFTPAIFCYLLNYLKRSFYVHSSSITIQYRIVVYRFIVCRRHRRSIESLANINSAGTKTYCNNTIVNKLYTRRELIAGNNWRKCGRARPAPRPHAVAVVARSPSTAIRFPLPSDEILYCLWGFSIGNWTFFFF